MTPISLSSHFSSQETSPSTPRSGSWRGRTMMIGDSTVERTLSHLFSRLEIPIKLKADSLCWPRDARVVLPNQTHLIPFHSPYYHDRSSQEFLALLPIEMLHFLDKKAFGNGFEPDYRKSAIDLAVEMNLPLKKAKTCIEGGNCRIFTGADGKPKAIVGYNSLILSMMSLRRQKYFENHPNRFRQLMKRAPPPHPDSIRIAKNDWFFFTKQQKICMNFLSREEAHRYYEIGQEIEVMIEMTKRKIAEELEIPIQRIAFVYQERFHIDMELFAGPDDFVFLHDEEQMLHLQKKIPPPQAPFIQETIKHSEKSFERCKAMLQKNCEILQKIGCKPVLVPGVLDSTENPGEVINFMNGILLDGDKPYFLTNGTDGSPTALFFAEEFLDAVAKVCPALQVVMVDSNLPETLALYEGGLNCMTTIAR